MTSNEVMAAWLIMAASDPNDITQCFLKLSDHDKSLAAQHITNAIMRNDVERLQQGKRPLEEHDVIDNKKKMKQEKDAVDTDTTTTPPHSSHTINSFFNYTGFVPNHRDSKPIDLDPKPRRTMRSTPVRQQELNEIEVFMAKKSTAYHRRDCGKIFNSAEQDIKKYAKGEVMQFFKPCALCKP